MYNFDSLDTLIKEASAPSVNQLIEKYVIKEHRFDEDTFMQLMFTDPTFDRQSGKVGSYGLWLIKMFRTQPQKVYEDSSKVREYLEIYDKIKLKGTTPQEYKRIENFQSIPDLYNFIKSFRQDSEVAENVSSPVVYENDKWVVYAVDNPEDACSLGSNTGWCTAPENSNHYEGYASMGSLYVFINKFDKNEKYQFHYGSNQLADIDDRDIGIDGFTNHLKKGDSNDKALLIEIESIVGDAADEYNDRYSDEQYNQFDMYFWDYVDDEMENNIPGFENFNPKMKQYLIGMARDYLGDNLYFDSTDMYGRPEVYIGWEDFFEHIEKDLPEIMKQEQHRINDQTMDEAGQGKLFEYPSQEEERKVAMWNNNFYNYKNIDEMLKIARYKTTRTNFINIKDGAFDSLIGTQLNNNEYGGKVQIFSPVIDKIEQFIKNSENSEIEFNVVYNGNPIIIFSRRKMTLEEKQKNSSNPKDIGPNVTDIEGEIGGVELHSYPSDRPSYHIEDSVPEEVYKVYQYPDIKIYYDKSFTITAIKVSEEYYNDKGNEYVNEGKEQGMFINN
jgi:hypothetical protein